MKTSTKVLIILPSVVFALIVALVIFAIVKTDWSAPAGSTQAPVKPDYDAGYLLAQEHVKLRLKAPATARFPSEYTWARDKDDTTLFYYLSHVDAENSFGALLRNRWDAKMR